jgi:hypothetical protein
MMIKINIDRTKLVLHLWLQTALCSLNLSLMLACEDNDPHITPIAGEMNAGEMNAGAMNAGAMNAGAMNAGAMNAGESMIECNSPETDYPSESWEMCISDAGRYELAGANIPSSAARVAAYEAIADLLWRNDNMRSEDFIQAELIYGEEGGVGSRVTRRYDAHLPKPDGADCALEEAKITWPKYCVGPSMIEPMILDAFAEGNTGVNMANNAAKVKAGLLWFFYVSTYKEAYTCAGKAADCDSHWAYCNGAKQLDEAPFALGAEILSASEEAYDHLFNAHLAIRCWRDLDNAEVAENTSLHQQVLDQLDRALDYGYALMIRSYFSTVINNPEPSDAILTTLSILGPPLTRAALERDPELDEESWSNTWQNLTADNVTLLDAQLEALFACP